MTKKRVLNELYQIFLILKCQTPGLILSDRFAAEPCELDGHAVLKFRVKCGETVDYWTASGWNKGGIESPEAWNEYMKEQAVAVNNPLKVEVIK